MSQPRCSDTLYGPEGTASTGFHTKVKKAALGRQQTRGSFRVGPVREFLEGSDPDSCSRFCEARHSALPLTPTEGFMKIFKETVKKENPSPELYRRMQFQENAVRWSVPYCES